MRRALILLLSLAGCFTSPRPVIESFTVDQPNPDSRASVQFSYSVRGANGSVRIEPVPGLVHGSPVTAFPLVSGTFTLRAFNDDGVEASRHLSITVRAPFAISSADASPGQVAPGADVNLSWVTSSAERATLTDGATGEVTDAALNGSVVVRPLATTIYTLTAYNKPGRLPDALTAKITARVAQPPSVSDFKAAPEIILQGNTSTLSWSGDALSYSVTAVRADGATTISYLGVRRALVVRPAATTAYTLHAASPGGALQNPPTVAVTVRPDPASTLSYTAPADQPLQLIADACGTPCTTLTLRVAVKPGVSGVQLRGVALDLPLDTSKVRFDPASFASAIPGAVARATMGSGLLKDVLVVGIALTGNGKAPAADVTLNAGGELARFTLELLPAGGRGTVFDGFTAALVPSYKASIQRASGRVANAIAVGKLEAQ